MPANFVEERRLLRRTVPTVPSTPSQRSLDVAIAISREQYLKLYQLGQAVVSAQSTDGRRVQFPAQALRPWVGHHGIKGKFRIYFDEQNRLSRIESVTR